MVSHIEQLELMNLWYSGMSRLPLVSHLNMWSQVGAALQGGLGGTVLLTKHVTRGELLSLESFIYLRLLSALIRAVIKVVSSQLPSALKPATCCQAPLR